jgi:predicted DNA-binding WGR domain protein
LLSIYLFFVLSVFLSAGRGVGGGKAPANTAMTTIHLERREPVHNRQRFYTLTVVQTLFGSWTLIREWGRIGHPGTVRETWFETEAAAIEAGAKIRRQKERRGYHTIGEAP